jgi:hypothetical protein
MLGAGDSVGAGDGGELGFFVGVGDGRADGVPVGRKVGALVGEGLGRDDGLNVAVGKGDIVGPGLGCELGPKDGLSLGSTVTTNVGEFVAIGLGVEDTGDTVGRRVVGALTGLVYVGTGAVVIGEVTGDGEGFGVGC